MPDDKPERYNISDVIGKPECEKRFRPSIFLFVIGAAAILCFCGFGRRTLWRSVGETAVLAQRVLFYGILRALSGDNLIYQVANRRKTLLSLI